MWSYTAIRMRGGGNQNLNTANNNSFENAANFKHFGTTVTKLHSQRNWELIKFLECLLPLSWRRNVGIIKKWKISTFSLNDFFSYGRTFHIFSYFCYYQLILCSQVLFEKPPVAQLLKNFQKFNGTQKFSTMFTRALHWFLSWARWILSIPPHPISLRFSLILSSHLCVGLRGCLFWLSHQNGKCITLLPHSCYMPYSSHPPWLDHSNYTWRRVQVMKLLVMQFSPISCYFIPLQPKYFAIIMKVKMEKITQWGTSQSVAQ
jgi:hypothetical protein